MRETLPVGSLLIPNDYMVRNMSLAFAIILAARDDLYGPAYKLFLTNGIVKWLSYETIIDLFVVHRM